MQEGTYLYGWVKPEANRLEPITYWNNSLEAEPNSIGAEIIVGVVEPIPGTDLGSWNRLQEFEPIQQCSIRKKAKNTNYFAGFWSRC